MALDPALLPNDVDALKRLIVGMAREAVQADTLIEKLRFELARLKRARFGASSEKLGERVEQLELAIEALETDAAERLGAAPVVAEAVEAHASGRPGGRCPSICRARAWFIPLPALARPAAGAYAGSART